MYQNPSVWEITVSWTFKAVKAKVQEQMKKSKDLKKIVEMVKAIGPLPD